MEFILDTNAFRNLATRLSYDDIPDFTAKLREANLKNGATPSFSIVVAMELMKHLQPGDFNFKDCLKALRIMVGLTKDPFDKLNKFTPKPKNPFHDFIRYSLPMNFVLSLYFFNKIPAEYSLLWTIRSWAENICMARGNYLKYQDEIRAIDSEVIYEKKALKIQIEKMIKDRNEGKLDWLFYNKKANKPERLAFIDTIRGERSHYLLSASMYLGTLNFWGWEYEIEPWLRKKEVFIKDFKPALEMTVELLEKVIVGSPRLGNVFDSKWNTLMDINIIMSTMFKNKSNEQKILVTLDGPLTAAMEKGGYGNNVISLWDYLFLMKIPFDKSLPVKI